MGKTVVVRHVECSHDASSADSLLSCLGISPHIRVISLVGAGGKTSLMYALAREVLSLGKTVVTTTTTKIRSPERHESPCLILVDSHPGMAGLPESVLEFGHVTVAQSYLPRKKKLQGVEDDVVECCALHADAVIIEADGALRRPIKAPEQWEPVIPRSTDLVIPVVGLDCIGKPATAENVFRLERFTDVTGVREGREITPTAIARLLAHPAGAFKGVPPGIPVIPFLNKCDQLRELGAIDEIARVIDEQTGGRIDRIVAGSLLRSKAAAMEPAERSSP